MTLFGITWQCLDLPAPQQRQIAAATLLEWQQANHLIRQARRRTAKRLLRARQARCAVRHSGKQYLQLMRKRAQAQTTQYYEQVRTQAIQDSVQWLVDTQHIELALAQRLAKQARAWAVAALKTLVGNLDQRALLIQQLQQPFTELQDQGALTLRVHPDHSRSLQQTFAQLTRLSVVADVTLQPLQAVLESPLVSIQIDLEQHLQLLIEQLNSAPGVQTETLPPLASDQQVPSVEPAEQSEPAEEGSS